jgi:hypothetical protein
VLSYSIDQLDASLTTLGRAVAALAHEIALDDEYALAADLEVEDRVSARLASFAANGTAPRPPMLTPDEVSELMAERHRG